MSLEDLREFLQEKIGESIYLHDDIVIEQLKVSMSELRKMKLDFPPPGYFLFMICNFMNLCTYVLSF